MTRKPPHDLVRTRLRERFFDPEFQSVERQIAEITDAAWKVYGEYHKSPRTRKAGPGFADPEFELPIEWLETRERVQRAEREQKDAGRPGRVLLVCCAARHDQTCPGEMSKTFRLASQARGAIEDAGLECGFLDLSLLTAQYGRQILPCKACVSTAMPLCHWPCSCYPNHAMGQVVDWMNELYPRWVAAHGVMIITPSRRSEMPRRRWLKRWRCRARGDSRLSTRRPIRGRRRRGNLLSSDEDGRSRARSALCTLRVA